MSANAADYQVARGYLELIAELPWHATTDDNLDLSTRSRCWTRITTGWKK